MTDTRICPIMSLQQPTFFDRFLIAIGIRKSWKGYAAACQKEKCMAWVVKPCEFYNDGDMECDDPYGCEVGGDCPILYSHCGFLEGSS